MKQPRVLLGIALGLFCSMLAVGYLVWSAWDESRPAHTTKESERYSSGFQIYESMVFDGKNLELEGKYAKAREKYLEVARELKGQKVPFYWFAQASAWSCVYYQWDQADPAGKKALESEIAAARTALPEIIEKGLREKDRRGAGKASLILGLIHYQQGEWKDSSRVLQVFAGELADEATFRCTGLASLILARVKTGALKEAAENFKSLYADCKQATVVATVSSALADAFEEAGNLPEAARYTLFYAKHTSSKSDMENPREMARVARRLIDGGTVKDPKSYIKDAQGYIAKLKEAARGDADLERTVIVLEARVLVLEKEWDKAIAKLEAYVKQYRPVEDKSYDDAYALHDLGEAYLARRGPKSTIKDLTDAHDAYNQACFVMRRRMQREPALEKTFWKWVERLMTIKMQRGDTAGEVNQYREIVAFLGEQKNAGDMGGLKDRLLKISADAAAKLEKAQAKSP